MQTESTATPSRQASVQTWHTLSPDESLQAVGSQAAGLSADEAARRLAEHGPNRIEAQPGPGFWQRLLRQFNNPLIYVLLAAALMTLWLRDYLDAAVILGVVIINAVIGMVQEGKAQKALEAVRAMLASHAMVLRDGERREIDAAELVPGDVVLLESGTRVPADLRLIRSKNLQINEAALTGESVPTAKSVEGVEASAALGDRACMAYAGTVVTVGQGSGVVVATAGQTEIGRIGALVASVGDLVTPLARRLDTFARRISVFILVLGVATFLYGYFIGGRPALGLFLVVVGLAVAAIPEGLPAVVTITLAIGTRAMARSRAIVRHLPAVEALGSVGVICTDKTGTLTKNEMTAVRVTLAGGTLEVSGAGYEPEGGFQEQGLAVDPQQHEALQRLARCALLCNDARLHRPSTTSEGEGADADAGWTLAGDPTEGGLLTLALKAGLDLEQETARTPRSDGIPFESEQRYMATLHHEADGRAFVLLKGAPERVLPLCVQSSDGQTLDQAAWQALVAQSASEGQRVLALAECSMPEGTRELASTDITPRFTLLGLVGMMDPPRAEAVEAVADCQRAGVRVVMITGDHAVTAASIAAQLGLNAAQALSGDQIDQIDDAGLEQRLAQTDVVARASPEHKLRLVGVLQAQGHWVAMTGDGVNDAPALKAADVGVAMGQRGTDAAREAADLVLTDDNFASIAKAVRVGRTVFDNIKKTLLFILPTNGGEGGLILLAVGAGMAMPITAAQILWVNMVTSVTLDMALAFEPSEPGVMRRPPRPPKEPIITRLLLTRIVFVSILMMGTTFGVYEWALARGSSIEVARTAVVNMLVLGEIAYLFNVRSFTGNALAWGTLRGNAAALWVSGITLAMQMLFTYAPPMQKLFKTAPLDTAAWSLIVALSIGIFVAVEVEKWLLRRMGVARF